MIVLSLFNGMNTGRQALENVGIKVNKYYSSEIKSYAIELTQFHFPDTIQVGDITKWKDWDIDWSNIDLVLSGSPCQDLSAAGKRAGINGSKSSLFFVFVSILQHIKSLNPGVLFLQENVASAKKVDVGIMSRALGVYPVRINSKLVTAQLRDRYYWTNIKTRETLFDIITDIPQPIDKKIMFKDIITSGTVDKLKSGCLMESISRVVHTYKGITSREKFGVPIIYVEVKKHTCLNTNSGNGGTQRYLKHRNKTTGMLTLIQENEKVRTVNKVEMCRLQGFPDDYCDILTRSKAGSLLGDGWTLPIIEHIFSYIKK
jgi:DNA-cytosine methyltransferase